MNFTKMQATGNDFVVIEARETEFDWVRLSRRMCRRRFGVGADGVISVLDSSHADFRMRMFNPDGSEAEACGNGLRCFVRYVRARHLTDKSELTVETMAGDRETADSGDLVRVAMGAPRFQPKDIPASVETDSIPVLDYPLIVRGRTLPVSLVSMGNPHAITFLEEPVVDFPLAEIGPLVEYHGLFPKRTNFEIVNVLDRDRLRVRVWERGAGETLSCGSGACGVAVAARLHGFVGDRTQIEVPGGSLTLEWDGTGEVWLSGPAELVFEGTWEE